MYGLEAMSSNPSNRPFTQSDALPKVMHGHFILGQRSWGRKFSKFPIVFHFLTMANTKSLATAQNSQSRADGNNLASAGEPAQAGYRFWGARRTQLIFQKPNLWSKKVHEPFDWLTWERNTHLTCLFYWCLTIDLLGRISICVLQKKGGNEAFEHKPLRQ